MKILEKIRAHFTFIYSFTLSAFNIFAIIILASSFSLARVLPTRFGWEMGLIENMQVGILLIGALIALSFCPQRIRHAGNAIAGAFALMIGRELSWGRDFLTPTKVTEMGPQFPAMKEAFAWWPILYLAIGLACVAISHGFWHDFRHENFKKINIPVWSFVLIIISVIMQHIGEHGQIPWLTHPQCQTVEEFAEFVVYLELVDLTLYYGFAELALNFKTAHEDKLVHGHKS